MLRARFALPSLRPPPRPLTECSGDRHQGNHSSHWGYRVTHKRLEIVPVRALDHSHRGNRREPASRDHWGKNAGPDQQPLQAVSHRRLLRQRLRRSSQPDFWPTRNTAGPHRSSHTRLLIVSVQKSRIASAFGMMSCQTAALPLIAEWSLAKCNRPSPLTVIVAWHQPSEALVFHDRPKSSTRPP
jgi:hypothetical protein